MGVVALIAAGESYTHAELNELRADDSSALVWVIAERTVDTVVRLLGLFERGVPMALLHPKLTDSEQARLRGRVPSHAVPGDTAAIIFTSGSSAAPKGVVLSKRAFTASAAAHAANLGWRPDDRWLCCLPLAHIGGLSILIRCSLAGACIVLSPEQPFDPDEIIDTIARQRVTLISLVPAMLAKLLDQSPRWRPPSHLRAALIGGANASPALIARARERGVPTLESYGMTETCSQIYTGGKPVPGVELRALDRRIWVRGPMLASGYIDLDGLHPLADADGWFDTGDLGSLDADGTLHIAGRADDCIISGGANVAPAEVEHVLEASPDVAAACVVGIHDDTWGQIVAAAVVAASEDLDTAVGRQRLATFVRNRLASYKLPRHIRVIDSLPTGPTGKVDRRRVASCMMLSHERD